MSPRSALSVAWEALSVVESGCVVGIGIDLVEVRLVDELVRSGGQAFVDTVWTDVELGDSERVVERLAARWAAKEAVMKVLGIGLGDLEPLDIEIHSCGTGAPEVVLRGSALRASRQRRAFEWSVSMTHEGGWAAAIAIAGKHSHQGSASGNGRGEPA